MSTSSQIYGLAAATLNPGPRFTYVVTPEGMTTGSMDFTCRKGAIDTPVIKAKLAKGTLIGQLYPQVPAGLGYLRVDSYTSRDEPGAYSVVSVEFKGVDVSGTDYTFEGSVVYSRNNALADAPIFTNPRFLAQVTENTRDTIKGGADGIYIKNLANSTTSSFEIVNASSGALIETLTDENFRFWWDYIVTKGHLTYPKATSDWTKTATGKGALRSADFADFGMIDDPPGSPAALPGDVWIYSGATESIAVSGDGANSYSKTWTSGSEEDYPTQIFGPEA